MKGGLRLALRAAGGLIGLGLVVAPFAPAFGADAVTVAISDVQASATGVSGVLTLKSKSDVRVDPTSVVASVDGNAVPVTIDQKPAVQRRAMLVIDTSGSMGSAGMATVRASTAQYLRTVPADVKVGVATFADTAGVDLAPTTSHAAVQRVVNGLASRGDTSLYAGVRAATEALGKSGDRSIILLSDGADTIATDESAARARAVAALRASGARVDVIQFKTKDPDATSALKEFASLNGGSVVAAVDSDAVTSAFNESAKALASQVKFAIPNAGALSGTHQLILSGTAGATAFSFTRPISFAPTPIPGPVAAPAAPAAPADGAPVGASALPAIPPSVPWHVWLAVTLAALGAFGILFALLAPSLETNKERRVADIESYVHAPRIVSRSEGRAPSTPFSEQLSDLGERFMKGRKSTAGTLALIDRADLPFRAGDWFILTAVSVVMFSAFGFFFLSGIGVWGLLVGALIGLAVPPLALRHLATKRAKNFEAVLPDVLMLVSTSLRSGFGLPQALDAVARDAAEPAAKEFSRALAETRIGTDVADALDRTADRMDSKALRWTVMAIRVQRDVGGNLADTLVTTSATLRERESLFRQVRALSAEGRISAAILVALPFGLFLYMMAVNREYISLLWTRPIGVLMIGAGMVLMAIGVFWMSRLVKIEV